MLFGAAFFAIPGIGPVLVAGPLVAWIIGALEGAVVVGGLSALGAGLYSIGIPKDSVVKYEAALKSDKFILLAHGTAAEVATKLRCSHSFIYRRLDPKHSQYIPNKRQGARSVRINERLIADLLSGGEDGSVGVGSAVLVGSKMTRSRHRDREGSLIIRGRRRKFWLSQWPEGNKRRSNKLGWCDADDKVASRTCSSPADGESESSTR